MEINDYTIYINRGNTLSIELTIDSDGIDYEFKDGDIVKFQLYEEKNLKKKPIISKEFIPVSGSKVAIIELNNDEMTIGESKNYNIEYWYQISLNNEIVIGYDKEGAKKLILNPRGVENGN